MNGRSSLASNLRCGICSLLACFSKLQPRDSTKPLVRHGPVRRACAEKITPSAPAGLCGPHAPEGLIGWTLNKGDARNVLARAVFFNRLGEIRDRSFEQQRYQASGLNLVTAVIVLSNTVYLERATTTLRGNSQPMDAALLQHLSPLGWEHINLTSDYLWRSSAQVGADKFRPMRPQPTA